MRFIFLLLLFPVLASAQEVTLTDSNLPIFVVTTSQDIPDEPKLTAQLQVFWQEDGSRNFLSNEEPHYDGFIGIERRGSTSQGFEKTGYGFETRNADGSNNNVALLGLPEENDWVLHGPYSDKSLIRNALAFTLAADMMDYAPRVRFCELIVNDDYRGIYLLIEKIKRDRNRVDIARLRPEDTEGDQLTGGYILKMDKSTGAVSDGFVSGYRPLEFGWQETYFQFHYPKPDEIQPEQAAYIQDYVAEFENVLRSNNWLDETDGYRKYLNIEAFIDHMWVQEIARNVDSYRLSTYLYKDRDSLGGKLSMGPAWDYNLAFGNVNYCTGPGYEGWVWDFNDFCPEDTWVIHFWWERLREDPEFRSQATERWRSLRTDRLTDSRLRTVVDSLENLLGEAAERNFTRFPILQEYIWPNPVVLNEWPSEVDQVRQWVLNRVSWMDQYMNVFENTGGRPNSGLITLEVSPNPSSEDFQFTFPEGVADLAVELQVFDAQGRLIHSTTGRTGNLRWSATGVAKGAYFYRVNLGLRRFEGKLIVVR